MNFDELKFVRLTQPEQFSLIPRTLFEQIKGRNFIIDRIYQFGPIALSNPFTHLYVLAEESTAIIKGFLWAEINPYTEGLSVITFSLDKEYQSANGKAIKCAKELLDKIAEENKLTGKMEMVTIRPKAYEKAGWRKSEKIMMEI